MGYTYDPQGTAYRLHGGKHTCPSCGRHTLQLYINVTTGDPINDSVGKCDRHYNCGYDYPPKAYYADHPEELPPSKDGVRRYPRQEQEQPIIPIPTEYVQKSLIPALKEGVCDFVDYLLRIFDAEDVQRVITTYFLGMTRYKAVIFWQVDMNGIVREGKAMAYNPRTGCRDKASFVTGDSFWVYSTLQARGVLPPNTKSSKCMFGEHLLRKADNKTDVYIVESEKNAVIGSLILPDAIWLAVGSFQDVGKVWKVKDVLSRCRSVVFVPDADAIGEWMEQVRKLRLPNATISNLCAGHPDGYDVADAVRYMWLADPRSFRSNSTIDKPPINESAASFFDGVWENMTEDFFNSVLSHDAIFRWQIQIDKEGMPF